MWFSSNPTYICGFCKRLVAILTLGWKNLNKYWQLYPIFVFRHNAHHIQLDNPDCNITFHANTADVEHRNWKNCSSLLPSFLWQSARFRICKSKKFDWSDCYSDMIKKIRLVELIKIAPFHVLIIRIQIKVSSLIEEFPYAEHIVKK